MRTRALSRRQFLGLGAAVVACDLEQGRSTRFCSRGSASASPSATVRRTDLPVGLPSAASGPHLAPPDRALKRRFPGLADRLAWVTLAALPTPLERARELEQVAGFGPIWVKRDDLSHDEFGGGKPRKLELLLAEAIAAGYDHVITFGGAGSNQALATAVHGRRLGLRVELALAAQPPSDEVRVQLRAMVGTGALVRFVSGVSAAETRANEEFQRRGRAAPWVIPVGGTSPLGNLAFVDAAFELADQINAGLAPVPDRIYVAGGTLGTAVGLCLGLHLAGVHSRVIAVRASSPALSSSARLRRLARETVAYAHRLDTDFPEFDLAPSAFSIDGAELGGGYGHATGRGQSARRLAATTEHWRLDDTYTAKALAALLADKPAGVSLIWLTQSAALPRGTAGKLSELPPELTRYLGT